MDEHKHHEQVASAEKIRPSWLSFKSEGKRTEIVANEQVTLNEYTLIIDPSQMKQDRINNYFKDKNVPSEITDRDIETLQKYKAIELKIWTADPLPVDGDGWYSMTEDPNLFVALFGSGLASSHEQWINPETSFVHKWSVRFSENFRQADEKNKHKLVNISLSCPGFGGAHLKDKKNVKVKDVDDVAYAKTIKAVKNVLGLEDVRKIGIGHSAGAEAMGRLAMDPQFDDDMGTVLLNPAFALDKQKQFQVARDLASVKKVAEYVVPGIANLSELLILNYLVGTIGEKSAKPLLKGHQEQIALHPDVYRKKLDDLEAATTIDYQVRPKKQPQVLIGGRDALTPKKDAQDYLEQTLRSRRTEKVARMVLNFNTPDAALHILQSQDVITTVENAGHDTVFIDSLAQDQGIDLMMQQTRLELISKDPYYKSFADKIAYCFQNGMPLRLRYVSQWSGIGERIQAKQRGFTDEKEEERNNTILDHVDKTLNRAETLCRWIKAVDKAKEWDAQLGEDGDPNTIPVEERHALLELIINTSGNKAYLRKNEMLDEDGNLTRPERRNFKRVYAMGEIIYSPMEEEDKKLLDSNRLHQWIGRESSDLKRFAGELLDYLDGENVKDSEQEETRQLIRRLSQSQVATKIKELKFRMPEEDWIPMSVLDLQAQHALIYPTV